MGVTTIRELTLGDGSIVHEGDERRITVTTTDDGDIAKEPTQVKITFTPPSGSANAVTWAKTPTGVELTLTQISTGIYYCDQTFDEHGWWIVVTAGSSNMIEVDSARVYVEEVIGAPA